MLQQLSKLGTRMNQDVIVLDLFHLKKIVRQDGSDLMLMEDLHMYLNTLTVYELFC